jgi:probable rRNA maturation factor
VAAIAVDVRDRQDILRVSPRWLARVVRTTLRAERVGRAEIGISLVDDRRIAALHRRWLGVPGPTDVITFDLSPGGGPRAAGLAGDLVVSAETARRMARAVGWTAHRELAYYVVHGLLHLAGYDDHAPADRRVMRARERVVMRACGLPAPPRPAGDQSP